MKWKTILKLKLNTDQRWVNIAEKNIADIHGDHAGCEQKAASTGNGMIIHYQETTRLVDELTDLVAEEWSHFERVLLELDASGMSREDAYAIVQAAAMRAMAGDGGFRANLEADPNVRSRLPDLEALFDPNHYLEHIDVAFDRLELGVGERK